MFVQRMYFYHLHFQGPMCIPSQGGPQGPIPFPHRTLAHLRLKHCKQVQTGPVAKGESCQIMRKCPLGAGRPTCKPASATEDECASG